VQRRHFLGSALFAMAPVAAFAQGFPDKVIRLIAASAPGGTVDLDARLLAGKFPAMGQPSIVENRAGAAGYIATEYVARQPADGYTLLVAASSHTTNHLLHSKMTLDPVKDFAPISLLTSNGFILTVPASSPANNLKELIALGKKKAGGLSYSTPGVGQAAHLGMELFKTMAGIKAVHVPYTGTGPATVAVLGQQVDMSFITPTGAMEHVKSGKLKALAVTSKKRMPSLPNVPTIDESGFRGYELLSWIGLLAPAGTPADVVQKLYEASASALKQPDVKAQLAAIDTDAVGSSPQEFTAFLTKDVAFWEKVIQEAGVKGD
jgi:tripartite-type tricarboxylate transporter receptor subunit TctC